MNSDESGKVEPAFLGMFSGKERDNHLSSPSPSFATDADHSDYRAMGENYL